MSQELSDKASRSVLYYLNLGDTVIVSVPVDESHRRYKFHNPYREPGCENVPPTAKQCIQEY